MLRKVLFWLHLTAGAVAGIVILLMSATGVLLTYQRQIVAWADSGIRVEIAEKRAPVAALLATAAAVAPDAKPTTVTFRADPGAPASVALGRGRSLYVNPYTAASLGEGATGVRSFFRTVTDLHRWLALKDASRETGKLVTGASNLLFLFLVLSGMVLWLPRRWTRTQVRAVALPRRGLSGKARDFNWHHVAGLWFALPLVVVVASGVVISFPWASALVYRAVGEQPPAPSGAAAPSATSATSGEQARSGARAEAPAMPTTDLDAFVARAMAHTNDWRTVALQIPAPGAKRVSFTLDAGDGGQPQLRRTLAFDRASGEVAQDDGFAAGSTGRRLRSILRFAHTGEVLGIPGQTVAGLASLAGVLLVWTGLALSFRRLAAFLGRVSRPATRSTPSARPAFAPTAEA